MRVIIAFLILCAFSCSSKKTVVEKQSPEKVVIDSLIITKVPDATEKQVPPPLTQSVSENVGKVPKENNTIPPPPEPPKLIAVKDQFDHARWHKILQKHVSENGKVDYLGIKNSMDLDVYIDMITHTMPNDTWTKSEKLAYWINAYNALTIDLILRNYPIKSIKDIKDPWGQRFWQFGDKWLNLNYIEHNILRKMDEPRIHFAIVCASDSCPKLLNEAYTASDSESQLTKATKDFLNDKSKNEINSNSLKLSKIFKWFANDFKQNGSLIDFLNKYSEITISENAKKSYKDYNWELND
ncbi:DUF547 domain-containing protein [Winogradskyella sp. A2]|uniref:DUF547 domain-containing protein n=1 Tax=Winogradskyella sp. A2 TaxID=3366944 RepID=UPI00398C39D1